jgi:hypothetical protein
MNKQAEKTQPVAVAEPGQELVLPDESDRMIADLRSQLRSLQGQLASYQQDGQKESPKEERANPPAPASAAGAGGQPPIATDGGAPKQSWSDEWAPQLADRLRAPAQDLTARLERVIAQVQDPVLRDDLEHCLQTAFYLFATFRHISDNHRLLLGSLEQEQARIGLAALRDALQKELSAQGSSTVPDVAGEGANQGFRVSPAAPAVAATVARIAAELIGEVIRVTVESESGRSPRAPRDTICITIACAGTRRELTSVESASDLIFKPDVSAVTVVDWLYMEKIVELQGGTLRLYHRGDRAAGFQLRLPAEAQAGTP